MDQVEAFWDQVRAWLEQQWATIGPEVRPYVAGAVVALLLVSFMVTTTGSDSGKKGRRNGGH